jgi:hypothetical protein
LSFRVGISELQETKPKFRPGAQLQGIDQSSLRALIRRIQELEREKDQLKTQRWKIDPNGSIANIHVRVIEPCLQNGVLPFRKRCFLRN